MLTKEKANKTGFNFVCLWWSRRELNSRLTGSPKGFLHAYAAIVLKAPSLRPKKTPRKSLKAAAVPALYTAAVARLVDARIAPTGKGERTDRLIKIKRRAQTERLREVHCYLHLHLNRMFWRGHSFLGVLTFPLTGNRIRDCPVNKTTYRMRRKKRRYTFPFHVPAIETGSAP